MSVHGTFETCPAGLTAGASKAAMTIMPPALASLTLIGCAWYNWKPTGSVLLTTSVTVAQLFTTATAIALIIYVITRLNPGKSERLI